MNLKITNITQFKGLESRLVACSDILFELDGKPKKARFFITLPDLKSVLVNEKNLDKIQESMKSILQEDLFLNRKWEFDGVFYYLFTGSHFQIEDEKPEWATDYYSIA